MGHGRCPPLQCAALRPGTADHHRGRGGGIRVRQSPRVPAHPRGERERRVGGLGLRDADRQHAEAAGVDRGSIYRRSGGDGPGHRRTARSAGLLIHLCGTDRRNHHRPLRRGRVAFRNRRRRHASRARYRRYAPDTAMGDAPRAAFLEGGIPNLAGPVDARQESRATRPRSRFGTARRRPSHARGPGGRRRL